MIEVEARVRASAPRQVIWQVLAEADRWAEWGPWTESRIVSEGSPDPAGMGAIKILRRAPVTVREEITEFSPPERYGYRVLSGLPLRDYEATVTVSEDGEIHWRSTFEPKRRGTGPLMRAWMQSVVSHVAKAAAREAERRA